MAQSVIRIVVGAYRSKRTNFQKNAAPSFKRPQVQFQYNRDWSFTKNLVSLRTLTRRRRLQFQTGAYQQKKYFNDHSWSFGGARLVERKGHFYLHVSLQKKTPALQIGVTASGIDLGIRTLVAVRVLGKKPLIIRGGKLSAYREKMVRLRRRLQAKGTRSSRRLLKHLRQREKRFVLDVCRKTAKRTIDYASKSDQPVLIFETLSGIRNRTYRHTKKSRNQLHTWPFYLLKRVISEKAEELGIKVISINPAYTSQRCPRCGVIKKQHRQRDNYHCSRCNYQNNADVVAATNLAWMWFNDVNRIESGVLSTTQTYRILPQDTKYKPYLSISGS
jgi:IS605 OrfB family transposase